MIFPIEKKLRFGLIMLVSKYQNNISDSLLSVFFVPELNISVVVCSKLFKYQTHTKTPIYKNFFTNASSKVSSTKTQNYFVKFIFQTESATIQNQRIFTTEA